jgi:hypothetical protein
MSLALERSFSQPVFRTTLLTDGDHLRKVLGGVQPPRARAMARKRKATEAERRARKSPTRLYKPRRDFIGIWLLLLPAGLRGVGKPLACNGQWRESANRMVKRPSPERRATAGCAETGPRRSDEHAATRLQKSTTSQSRSSGPNPATTCSPPPTAGTQGLRSDPPRLTFFRVCEPAHTHRPVP